MYVCRNTYDFTRLPYVIYVFFMCSLSSYKSLYTCFKLVAKHFFKRTTWVLRFIFFDVLKLFCYWCIIWKFIYRVWYVALGSISYNWINKFEIKVAIYTLWVGASLKFLDPDPLTLVTLQLNKCHFLSWRQYFDSMRRRPSGSLCYPIISWTLPKAAVQPW